MLFFVVIVVEVVVAVVAAIELVVVVVVVIVVFILCPSERKLWPHAAKQLFQPVIVMHIVNSYN